MGMMGSKGSKGLVCDINVTPLVDVMLVLLIIFMITAPMMNQSGDINLPETFAKELRQTSEPLAISIDKEGRTKLKETEMTAVEIMNALNLEIPDKEERKKHMIYLSADKDVPYEKIYSLFEELVQNGFTQVGMATKHIDDVATKRQ